MKHYGVATFRRNVGELARAPSGEGQLRRISPCEVQLRENVTELPPELTHRVGGSQNETGQLRFLAAGLVVTVAAGLDAQRRVGPSSLSGDPGEGDEWCSRESPFAPRKDVLSRSERRLSTGWRPISL